MKLSETTKILEKDVIEAFHKENRFTLNTKPCDINLGVKTYIQGLNVFGYIKSLFKN